MNDSNRIDPCPEPWTASARYGPLVAAIAIGLGAFQFAMATSEAVARIGSKEGVDGSTVRAELVADAAAVEPGKPFRLGVRLVVDEGWHLNWVNPGDAGLAPTIRWELPEGFKAEPMRWPSPKRYRTGPVVIFGYDTEVLLAAEVTPPPSLRPGEALDLSAEVAWLACAESCVPGAATVSLRLPVEATARGDVRWRPQFDEARRRCPEPAGAWRVEAVIYDASSMFIDLQSAGDTPAVLEGVFFYPYEAGIIENAATQALSILPGPDGRSAYRLRVERSRLAPATPSRLSGVLVAESGWSSGGGSRAIEIDVPLAVP